MKVRGTDQWTVRSMGEPPIRRWSEWGDVFCQNAKETVHVRRECGVQAFCPKGKTLKWAGFACPFEFDPGPPQSPKVLWGNQSDQWVSPSFADGASGGMFFCPKFREPRKRLFCCTEKENKMQPSGPFGPDGCCTIKQTILWMDYLLSTEHMWAMSSTILLE